MVIYRTLVQGHPFSKREDNPDRRLVSEQKVVHNLSVNVIGRDESA